MTLRLQPRPMGTLDFLQLAAVPGLLPGAWASGFRVSGRLRDFGFASLARFWSVGFAAGS